MCWRSGGGRYAGDSTVGPAESLVALDTSKITATVTITTKQGATAKGEYCHCHMQDGLLYPKLTTIRLQYDLSYNINLTPMCN